MTRPVNPKPSSRTFVTATISTATDGLSTVVNLTGLTLSCIEMSTSWSAGSLGFRGNVDGSTNYYTMYGSTGDVLSYATTGSRLLIFDPAQFAGVQVLQLISQTTNGSSAIAQASPRTIRLGLSEYVKAE